MSSKRLDLKQLVVASFATAEPASAAAVTTGPSQDAACMSPFCGPTYWETCEPTVATA
ncbi:MAG TPA: hypothetical protein VE913_23995 [Longimicrobium sp.]|nr:hypothetical protein [Longimicrobium sp.]